MKEFNRINREIVYKGAIIDFCKDTIITPKNHTVKWDLIKHKGAAAIIPVTNDGRIIMVRQWRNAVDKFSLEIPAGGLDITLEIYSVEELLEKIMKNEINDAKTVSAILTYYNKYCCNK